MAIGRVTNNLLHNSTLGDIKNNNLDLLALQKKLTTGKAINNISDDPLGVNRVLDYDLTIDQNNQYVKNLDNATSELGITDNSLDGLHSLINRAKVLALSQINGSASSETRDATAIEVNQILQQLVTIANTQIGSSFIFGGSLTSQKPFELIGDEVIYLGNNDDRETAISHNIATATNLPGSKAFGIFQNRNESSFDLKPSLQEKIFFETEIETNDIPAGFTFALKDVPEQNIIGKELIITRGQNQGISVKVLDYDPATKAVKVETQKFPISLVNGTKIAVVQAPTKVSDLNLGKGLTKGRFLGNIGSNSIVVDLSKANTISDVKEIIENSFGGAIKVSFTENGQGLLLQNLSNEVVSIKEDGRGTVARELGLVSSGVAAEIPPGGILKSLNITPVISTNTTLASLNAGAGINNLGFRIKNGSKEIIFDTNDMESISTVGDLINMINTANLSVDASINDSGTGIVIRSRSSGKGISIDNVMAKGNFTEKINETQFKVDPSAYTSEPEGLIGTQVLITNPDGKVQSRQIVNFDGKTLTLDSGGDFSPEANFEVYSSRRFLGAVESATTNSFTDTGAFKDAKNILQGGILKITEGKNAGTTFRINSANDDTVFFNNPDNIVLDETSTYEILTGTANSIGMTSFNTGAKLSNIQESSNITFKDFEITYGEDQIKAIVDVSSAENLQDVIDAIAKATNNAVVATLANGNAIKLEDSRTGPTLLNAISINDIGSSTTAKDLGLLGVESSQGKEFIGTDLNLRLKEVNIFTALFDLISGLKNNNINTLNNSGREIDDSLTILLGSRAEVGARLNRFDLSKNRLGDQTSFLTELKSKTLDADYVDTVFQFNNKKDVIDASLKAVGNLLKTSLLDYL
jgi:flagellar hook-associated protein 3